MSTKTSLFGRGSKIMPIISRIILVSLFLAVIYPLIFVVITSFKPTDELYVNLWLPSKTFMWQNYTKALIDGKVAKYFINSIIVVMSAVGLTCIIALLGGYALARLNIPRAGSIIMLFLSLTFVPTISRAIPTYIIVQKMKMINTYWSLIIPYASWAIPTSMYIFKNFIQSVPMELFESARIDGCKERQVFWIVTVPLIKPAVATVIVLNSVHMWGELMWANIVLSTTNKCRTLPLGLLAFKDEFLTDWGPLTAAMVISIIPISIFFIYLQKYFIMGLTGGAVKG